MDLIHFNDIPNKDLGLMRSTYIRCNQGNGTGFLITPDQTVYQVAGCNERDEYYVKLESNPDRPGSYVERVFTRQEVQQIYKKLYAERLAADNCRLRE
jgi:hypothetical protein